MSEPTNEDAALAILRTLREAGHVAYFAGGCVRDRLLGLKPKDHDVATSAPPGEVRKLFRNTQAVGAAFGVILVRLYGQQIEVATFRTDGSYSDGRRPDSIRFATPEEDALRRDFTINGLFLDPLSGEIIDFVGGRGDLSARILRAIGNPAERFAEDYLRMLRAIRFAARFGLTIDPTTASAIRSQASQIRKISPERVGDELRRMLSAPTFATAFRLLRELGLLAEVFRFLPAPDVHTLDLVPKLEAGAHPFAFVVAAAYIDDGYDPTAGLTELLTPKRIETAVTGLRRALRLSNDESVSVAEILTSLYTLLASPPSIAKQRRFLALPTAAATQSLLGSLLECGICRPQIQALLPSLANLSEQDNAPPPLLTGDDLVAQGLKPGPLFKRLLEATYDAQLESRITSKDQALTYALSLGK